VRGNAHRLWRYGSGGRPIAPVAGFGGHDLVGKQDAL